MSHKVHMTPDGYHCSCGEQWGNTDDGLSEATRHTFASSPESLEVRLRLRANTIRATRLEGVDSPRNMAIAQLLDEAADHIGRAALRLATGDQ